MRTHKLTQVLIRSLTFHSFSAAITYLSLQRHDSPHVPLYFQTTKRLRCSSLDLSASLCLIEAQLCFPVCLSVSQSVSPFTKLLALDTDTHSQKFKKKKKKEKRSTHGGISSGGEQGASLLGLSVLQSGWCGVSSQVVRAAHVGRERGSERKGREGSSTALWRCHTTSFYSRVGSWKIIIPHPPPQHKFKRGV